jgi:fibronectin-binding autotransporter adhesin
MARTPVNKRQFGTDAIGAPLSFNQLDSNFAYFENMAVGTPGYIPVIAGITTTKNVTGFNLEYAAGTAQTSSVIRQLGGFGISQAGIPLLEASASLQVFGSGHFTGSLAVSGGFNTTQILTTGLTASGVSIAQLSATGITGSFTGSIIGYMTGSLSGGFDGSASGYFKGQVDGTASYTTAPIKTILDNGNGATQSLFLQGGILRMAEGSLVVLGTSSFGGYINTENTTLGNNTTDVHFVNGGWNITAPYVNGTYQGGMNVSNTTNVRIGNSTTTIGGTVSLSSSLQVSGATTLNSSFQVTNTNRSVLGGTLSVGGNTSLTGSLQVSGTSVFNEDVTISNNHQLVVGGTTQ